MKIRTRFFIAFFFLISLGIFLLIDWVVDDLDPRYREGMEMSMVETATLLATLVESQIHDGNLDPRLLKNILNSALHKKFTAKIYQVTKTHLEMRVYVTDRKGIVLFDSNKGKDEGKNYSHWNDVFRTLHGQYGARTTRDVPEDPNTTVLYVAAPIKSGDNILGALTVCKPARSVAMFMKMAKRDIIVAGLLAAFSLAVLGALLTTWITRPIQKLIRHTRDIQEDKKVALPALGNSEIGRLGNSFEKMRVALEGKEYVEKYVQHLTHETKSPLSAIQGAVELLQEDLPPKDQHRFLVNIQREATRIQDMVDRMLQLAAIEKRNALNEVKPIALRKLLRAIVDDMHPVISSKDLRVNLSPGDEVRVMGECFLLRQAFLNLLQNAIDFSPEKGKVEINLSHQGNTVAIKITDQGPGLPEYAKDKIFDRFYSLQRPDGKKSSGLGLSFAKEVLLLHGGSIVLENQETCGVLVNVTIPLKC